MNEHEPRVILARRGRASAPCTVALFAALVLAGCAEQEPAANDVPEPAAPAAAGAAGDAGGQPEVFFTNIEDGGTYSSPVDIVFSVANFDIVPIEDPLVVRPGEGHYHLAVDVECAAAGDVIIAGNPSYIHFGSGADRIEMQFEPGTHGLCLQVADGEHRVIDGPDHSLLTKEIQITVE